MYNVLQLGMLIWRNLIDGTFLIFSRCSSVRIDITDEGSNISSRRGSNDSIAIDSTSTRLAIPKKPFEKSASESRLKIVKFDMSSTLHINADEDMMQLVRDDDCLPRSSKKPFSKSASESRLRIVRPSTSPRTRSPNSRYLPQMTLLMFGNWIFLSLVKGGQVRPRLIWMTDLGQDLGGARLTTLPVIARVWRFQKSD